MDGERSSAAGADRRSRRPSSSRGVGADPPPGGYQPGDLIFFGYDDGPNGHVALWLGNGLIVQCSSSGDGSNIRPLAGYVAPTGWVRWNSRGSGDRSTGQRSMPRLRLRSSAVSRRSCMIWAR